MLRVKNICKQQGITLKQLAERMDVSPEVVTRMLSENGNPTLSSLENIAKALGIEVYKLFDNFDADKMVQGYLEVGSKMYRINNFNDLQIVYNKITSGE
jgi:transcriptional regulator with XRE-family HTH domain